MAFYSPRITLCALSLTLGLAATTNTVLASNHYDRGVVVANESSMEIIEFYGSNTGTEEWEENILGEDTIAPDEEMEIDFDDNTGYCMFDFLVVFADKSEITEEKFNVCDFGTLTITD